MHHCQAFKALLVTKGASCCRPMACSWRTALQWRCARLCARCRRTAQLRAPAWPQVSHPHPLHVSYTHKTVRPYDTFQLNTKIDRYVTYQHAHTHPPTYTHIAMDKYNAKSCLSSRNWRVPVFCILIYCRGHHHYYKWCQYRRIISSAHTWSDQRVNQQLEVSFRNDLSDNRDNLHRNMETQLWWSCR